MTNIDPSFYSSSIDSVLSVKASGSVNSDIIQDLLLENGQDISTLLHDQTEKESPITK